MRQDGAMTTDDALSRIDSLELAVIQLADALEVAVSNMSASALHGSLDSVLDQVQRARELLGEHDEPDAGETATA
jgi:hypothetical protein